MQGETSTMAIFLTQLARGKSHRFAMPVSYPILAKKIPVLEMILGERPASLTVTVSVANAL